MKVPNNIRAEAQHAIASDPDRGGRAEIEFWKFLQIQDECRCQWLKAIQEAQRLQRELDSATRGMSKLEMNLFRVRQLHEKESKARKHAEYKRKSMEKKLAALCACVKQDPNINGDIVEQLASMSIIPSQRSSAHSQQDINDLNSTRSFLSDFLLTQSEDEFSVKMNRLSAAISAATGMNGDSNNDSDRGSVVTVVNLGNMRNSGSSSGSTSDLQNNEQILAKSNTHKFVSPQRTPKVMFAPVSVHKREVFSSDSDSREDESPESSRERINRRLPKRRLINLFTQAQTDSNSESATISPVLERKHNFMRKTFFRPNTCANCHERFRFNIHGMRCRDCKAVVHAGCAEQLSTLCVPYNRAYQLGELSHYTPTIAPMIPPLIVHCVNEIEMRGLNEVGIYRVPGSDLGIRMLKEQFLFGETLPDLSTVDINVLCGCVKDFLRSLSDPLIPLVVLRDFSNAVQTMPISMKRRALSSAIERLPQPNRDTLAFLMLHLQRIIGCKEIKMTRENLARVFAPTIVGYSSEKLDGHAIFAETLIQFNILDNLLKFPCDYWMQYMNIELEIER
ncbi:rac GTPase-activating protein 1-like [Toxorhynchites rutilus septentrionalis]|uniref:rac GTPase-activating protein 1-like n=1 Tax=Toxorhynchites rutilus septentrionalis TaxID=329112 RepID=UPI00247B1FD5|nr:rac GTPase-activating protein 1-like [Toxorhynchites rutilus septentrionalis]